MRLRCPMPDMPHTRRNSDRDVPETQMDYFMDRRTDSEHVLFALSTGGTDQDDTRRWSSC